MLFPGLSKDHFIHSEDSVYRRTYLMRHICKESGFSLIRIVRDILLLFELLHISVMLCIVHQSVQLSHNLTAIYEFIFLGCIDVFSDCDACVISCGILYL